LKLGCKRLSMIEKTKQERLHINIGKTDDGNKIQIKVHHDIFLDLSRYGHYSKSNDTVTKKFISDLKNKLE